MVLGTGRLESCYLVYESPRMDAIPRLVLEPHVVGTSKDFLIVLLFQDRPLSEIVLWQ